MIRFIGYFIAALGILGTTFAIETAGAAEPEFHAGRPGMPFSDVVRVGDLLFLSGRLGMRDGQLAAGGIQPETRAALESIRTLLSQHGSSMDRVVKCTVFLADMAEWAAMNEVYMDFFSSNAPARSAVGVTGLARNARVEIECIAAGN